MPNQEEVERVLMDESVPLEVRKDLAYMWAKDHDLDEDDFPQFENEIDGNYQRFVGYDGDQNAKTDAAWDRANTAHQVSDNKRAAGDANRKAQTGGGAGAGNSNEIFDRAAPGLKVLADFLPQYNKVSGGAVGGVCMAPTDIKDLYRRYDEQRDIDFGKFQRDADELGRSAEQIGRTKNDMAGQTATLYGHWTGSAADASRGYFSKFNQSAGELQEKLGGAQQVIAGHLGTIAKACRDKGDAVLNMYEPTCHGASPAIVDAVINMAKSNDIRLQTVLNVKNYIGLQYDKNYNPNDEEQKIIRDVASKWLTGTFQPWYGLKMKTLIDASNAAKTAVDAAWKEVVDYLNAVNEDPFKALLSGKSVGGQAGDKGGGGHTGSGGGDTGGGGNTGGGGSPHGGGSPQGGGGTPQGGGSPAEHVADPAEHGGTAETPAAAAAAEQAKHAVPDQVKQLVSQSGQGAQQVADQIKNQVIGNLPPQLQELLGQPGGAKPGGLDLGGLGDQIGKQVHEALAQAGDQVQQAINGGQQGAAQFAGHIQQQVVGQLPPELQGLFADQQQQVIGQAAAVGEQAPQQAFQQAFDETPQQVQAAFDQAPQPGEQQFQQSYGQAAEYTQHAASTGASIMDRLSGGSSAGTSIGAAGFVSDAAGVLNQHPAEVQGVKHDSGAQHSSALGSTESIEPGSAGSAGLAAMPDGDVPGAQGGGGQQAAAAQAGGGMMGGGMPMGGMGGGGAGGGGGDSEHKSQYRTEADVVGGDRAPHSNWLTDVLGLDEQTFGDQQPEEPEQGGIADTGVVQSAPAEGGVVQGGTLPKLARMEDGGP
ncbi:hypothetical protein D5S17_30620 [Pseudonocardiaceae bacterium YIM PH 21723]|nr:hypothetical protein D5S17_30620 [Pseudonocardiaceae bacterium YIM PH 21723]